MIKQNLIDYMIHQLNPTIDVSTPLGDCEALFLIDYGLNVNTVWVCRMQGGEVKHFYSDDIKVYGNPMNGKGWDLEWPVRETSPEFEGPIERFPPGFKETMQDKFNRESSPEKSEEDDTSKECVRIKEPGINCYIRKEELNKIKSIKDDCLLFFLTGEKPKGIQDPKGLQEAYKKALEETDQMFYQSLNKTGWTFDQSSNSYTVVHDGTSPKNDIYNPERLPEDGGRNRKKWGEIYESYRYDDRFVFFIKFLEDNFQAPKSYHFDTWEKVYNWYVSLSQYQDGSILDFLIEFYPAPDPKV